MGAPHSSLDAVTAFNIPNRNRTFLNTVRENGGCKDTMRPELAYLASRVQVSSRNNFSVKRLPLVDLQGVKLYLI